jgi:hypothetical protein
LVSFAVVLRKDAIAITPATFLVYFLSYADVPASAIRKMDRYGQKGTVAARIFKTASLGCFLQFLAVFLVEEAYLYCSKANEGKSKVCCLARAGQWSLS